MPKCKKADCREQAVPYGKRYCPAHLAEYKAKQAAYERLKQTLPDCINCGQKLSKTRADLGEDICGTCAKALEEEQARVSREEHLHDALDDCTTVDELREFIRCYLLP
jgi:hypothetical protein